MIKLLNIELKKYLTYATFWVLICLHFGLLILSIFIVSHIDLGGQGFDLNKMWIFPQVWNTISWISSWFNILLTILIIVITGNEFAFKTFKKNHLDGLSRNELIKSKIYMIFLISIYCIIVTFLTAIFTGLMFSGFVSLSQLFEQSYYIFIYFIQTIAYMSLGFFIVMLVRNTALSILFFLLYLFPVELIIRNIFPDEIAVFFPIKLISNLTPSPEIFTFSNNVNFTTTVNGQIVNSNPAIIEHENTILINVSIVLIYSLVFIFLSKIILFKRNL